MGVCATSIRLKGISKYFNKKTYVFKNGYFRHTPRCPQDIDVAKVMDAVKITALDQRI